LTNKFIEVLFGGTRTDFSYSELKFPVNSIPIDFCQKNFIFVAPYLEFTTI
jgi:hypothetical protein